MNKVLMVLGLLALVGCAQDGSQGAVGQDGVSAPSVVTRPATTVQCPSGGTQVLVGDSVTVICNGTNGSNGSDGQDGSDANIQFEQVCAGITPSYPSTFPELIMIVNHTAYGVYSANGGFWTLLPPGSYSSNGINASCTFTINADGSVSH